MGLKHQLIVSATLSGLCLTLPALAKQKNLVSESHVLRKQNNNLQIIDFDGKGLEGPKLVDYFLSSFLDSSQLSLQSKNFKQTSLKKSLTGIHYAFQQIMGDFPVEDASIIITTNLKGNKVTKIYQTLKKAPTRSLSSQNLLDQEKAFDIAWQHLKAHGDLFEEPKISSKIRVSDDSPPTPVHIVELSLAAPYGAWVVEIHATTGKVIKAYDQRLTRKNAEQSDYSTFKGKVWNRKKTFDTYQKKIMKQKNKPHIINTPSDIPTQVFDPDPRTSLEDATLEDDSDAQLFEDAYFQRILKEVSFDGSNYRLQGPWVSIVDFDPPTTPPHQQASKNWQFKRGANQFNEAMTYFHIDQSQRYIQSLGFSGDNGIQFTSIEIDADGANGDDNSYFQPSTNRISFGHGCVDDNEDADVILHEYGHAIQRSINENWYGGDTGAMGEGFGDYWAASYSFATPNGNLYFPNNVFQWDGQGENSSCWGGRILNALDARYDHSRSYAAHSTMPGGFISDELWSTPLFQSLVELISLGVDRREVDQIVLQSHFGLGSSLKMRDLALNTVETARLLYPTGPHAEVFRKHFVHHQIIKIPQAKLVSHDVQFKSPRNDQIVFPSDKVAMILNIINQGDLGAEGVQVKITSNSPDIEFLTDSAAIPAIDINDSYTLDSLSFQISSTVGCGELIPIDVEIVHDQMSTLESTRFYLRVGEARGISESIQVGNEIPDNNSNGITSELNFPQSEALVSENIKINIDLTHTYIGDLQVHLIAPDQTILVLHDRQGGNKDDIIGTYPTSLTPVDLLSKLSGKSFQGSWNLKVIDNAGQDVGVLNSWGIEDIVEFTCN